MQIRFITLMGAAAVAVACTDGSNTLSSPDDPALAVAAANGAQPADLGAPVFGLDAGPDGGLFAAETFAGVTLIRGGSTKLLAELSGVSGVAAIGMGNLMAVTGADELGGSEETARKLYRVSRGNVREVADLGAFEEDVNPDQVWNDGDPDSNPFNIAQLEGGHVLVADAAGNDILHVTPRGTIDWVAVLTPQLASTAPFKALIGCPNPAPECSLPDEIPAQPVATSIAVGPDGHFYAGELTGFPNPTGLSRIWRIARGSRHVLCPSEACTQVLDGFTAIVSLAFGPDGTLYVVQLDDDGWLPVEVKAGNGPLAPSAGGSVHACDVEAGTCQVLASGLALPTAVTVDKWGTVWVAENETIPGAAHVHPLP
jgi:hypothetical protein